MQGLLLAGLIPFSHLVNLFITFSKYHLTMSVVINSYGGYHRKSAHRAVDMLIILSTGWSCILSLQDPSPTAGFAGNRS